jgi:hypothetical protein
VGFDAPCGGRGHAPLEFVHALLGACDLDTARVDRQAEVAVLVGGLLAEQRHLLVVVDRKDEVRRVAGGAAGVGQRALVEQYEVGPTQAGQVTDDAVADDAGADDHARCFLRYCGGWDVAHRCPLIDGWRFGQRLTQ